MPDNGTTSSLSTLKSLLLDEEARRLERLDRRLDEVIATKQARDDIQDARIEEVFSRAGTEDRLRFSVAQVLDGALREAEVKRHEQLSQAIAPLVVRTIKHELKNSQDEMVEALYPLTGRLVKQYVQSAIHDMMAEIKSKPGGRRREILAQSAATGLDPGELALAEANSLEIEELFLLDRGSGDLIRHWQRASAADHPGNGADRQDDKDILISGYIAAITSFAEDAFGAGHKSFRTITLENGERLFVRGSAAHLMAVRARGTAPPAIETTIDEALLEGLEQQAKLAAHSNGVSRTHDSNTESAMQPVMRGNSLAPLAEQMQQRVVESRLRMLSDAASNGPNRVVVEPSFGRLYALAAAIFLPIAAWFAWSGYQNWQTSTTDTAVRRVIESSEGLRGYLPRVDVDPGGKAFVVAGLLPSEPARDELYRRLASEVPWAQARDRTAIVPGANAALDSLRLRRSEQTLAAVDSNVQALRRRVTDLAQTVDGVSANVDRVASQTAATADTLPRLNSDLATLRQKLEGLPAQPAPVSSPLAELDKFLRTTAIFFSAGLDLRVPEQASADLNRLVEFAHAVPDQRIRVVGYTDDIGTPLRNAQVAQQRADMILEELVRRGLARERLIAIGRSATRVLGGQAGAEGPNRRVEFELAFSAEPASSP